MLLGVDSGCLGAHEGQQRAGLWKALLVVDCAARSFCCLTRPPLLALPPHPWQAAQFKAAKK